MMNKIIIDNLRELEKEKRFEKDRFRSFAYNKAIRAIEKYDKEITSYEQAKTIDGIGESIAKKIQEIIDTGLLKVVEDNRDKNKDKHQAMELFLTVWGIGESKADQLFRAGYRTIADLQKPEVYSKLTHSQQMGLKYYADLLKRAPREQLTMLSKQIRDSLDQFCVENKVKIKMRLCGSYRRKCADSGDIDILLCCTKSTKASNHDTLFQEIIRRFRKDKILIEDLSVGSHKYMGITKLESGQYFRIDFDMVDPSEWAFFLLYFSGPASFNKRQRFIAGQQGYSLSEHGLKDLKTNSLVTGLKTEKDIFRQLGMAYLEPHERS